jgi:hypothetical protein
MKEEHTERNFYFYCGKVFKNQYLYGHMVIMLQYLFVGKKLFNAYMENMLNSKKTLKVCKIQVIIIQIEKQL